MGLIVIHMIIMDISHIESKCGKYSRIFVIILSAPRNIIIDLILLRRLIHDDDIQSKVIICKNITLKCMRGPIISFGTLRKTCGCYLVCSTCSPTSII
jgi:hypothetical protein